LTNIIVKLIRKDIINVEDTNVILLSSHYDSRFPSPGASDNGMGVSVLIEVFRNLVYSKTKIKNIIYFLFNNGEESLLLGSRAFMKDEKLTKNIKRFINLDSMSTFGKEIFLRSSPSILSKEYVVPYPHSSVIGEEIEYIMME
jgi:Zn-dependent M28 family amino/carboxypeptidase